MQLVPTGPLVPGDFTPPGTIAFSVGGNTVFNTDTGQILGALTRGSGAGVVDGIGFRVATQPSGPSVGVFSVAGFTLGASAHVTFTGSNAFALTSSGPIVLHGVVDGSCTSAGPGPGGALGGISPSGAGGGNGGGQPGALGGGGASGGGGGGYGDSGGTGGGAHMGGGNGGAIGGDLTVASFVLVGGSGGGAGGAEPGGAGGGGGGALMFSSDGDIEIDGLVTVGGCGGDKGQSGTGGGGGGSGGAIVVEGRNVKLDGTSVLAANGGGGGGGDNGTPGHPGGPGVTAATGGDSGSVNGGPGGNGGASNGMPGHHFTQGSNSTPGAKVGGGGGGGCGRIAVRAETGGIDDRSQAVTPDRKDVNANSAALTVYGVAQFK
jgi:hypothetical protein